MDDPPSETRALTARGSLMPEAKSAPRLNPLLVAHQIEVDNEQRHFEHENVWASCCLRLDRRGVVYFAQLAISVGAAAFSIAMMASHPEDCAVFSRFSPILSLVLGVWMPQPSLKGS